MASEHPLSVGRPDLSPLRVNDEPTLVLTPSRRRRRRWLRRLLVAVVLVLVLLCGGAALAYENPPLLVPLGTTLLGSTTGTVPWNGHDALTILVMGIDQRGTEQTRSDSMIVLHVDPATQRVTMLSVPRDLYVKIPGNYNYYKINAAYALGQPYGQGPQFAELAVESALHIPITYYAVVKFGGFKNVVDALGGVTVCVPHALHDPAYPDDVGYGSHVLDIKAGCQTMNGTLALEYARERHANVQEDLGRIQQQQAILTGIEKQVLSPATVLRLPAVMSAFNNAVTTDLPRSALPELGVLMGQARGDHTQHAYLNQDGGYVSNAYQDGQDVLAGDWPRINGLVTTLFSDPTLQAENASVQVENGQHTSGLAALYTTILQGCGFNMQPPRDADTTMHVTNLVIVNLDRPGADYTARRLTQMLEGVQRTAHAGASAPQVTVILGSNAAEGS